MAAIPISANGVSTPVADRFRADLARFERRHFELWRTTPCGPPTLGRRVGRRRQLANSRAARRLIDRLAREIERFPSDETGRAAWRQRLEDRLRRFGEERLDWPAGYRRLLFADAYFDSSVEFARRARRFDPALTSHEIGQGIRNVWIMNSLQLLLDRPVEVSPAVFAYSMLYPETDNYLDDPSVARGAKRRFNELLERRLDGERVRGRDPRQRRVFRLVGTIEGQWSRGDHPEVYESLLAIHRAQVESLAQDPPGAHPGSAELLALSLAKGGASVLADGYLVAGRLTADEADFCFGYGAFLQLLDDLQDREPDRAEGHATVFSTAAEGPPLDRRVARLYRFMRRVVEPSRRFAAPRYDEAKDLIVRNCTMLLVTAVADRAADFSPAFRRHLQHRWPLRFAAMRRLRRRADRRFRRAWATVSQRHGVDSPLDLI